MANRIDLGEVQAALSSFVDHSGEAADKMSTINSAYIDGTDAKWNTPAAAGYIDGLCGVFNDYISQFNSKYQDDVNSFVDGVNALSTPEQAIHVDYVTVTPLSELSKGWAGQEVAFNVPQDGEYAEFTQSNLTSNIESFNGILDSMQSDIDRAVASGLDGAFCTGLREALSSLKASAQDVSSQYSAKAAESAVNEDTNVQNVRNNT